MTSLLPQSAEDGLLERAAAPRAAAVVDRQNDVAVGREELSLEAERVIVLAVRPAVDVEQHRVALCRPVGRRLDHQAVDDGAVLARRGEILGDAQLEFAEPRVVLMRQPAERARSRARTPRRSPWPCRETGSARRPFPARGPTRCAGPSSVSRPGPRRPPCARRTRRGRRQRGTSGSGRRPTRPAGPTRPIQRRRQHSWHPPADRHDGELLLVVGREARLVALEVRDPLTVGAPGRAPAVGPS